LQSVQKRAKWSWQVSSKPCEDNSAQEFQVSSRIHLLRLFVIVKIHYFNKNLLLLVSTRIRCLNRLCSCYRFTCDDGSKRDVPGLNAAMADEMRRKNGTLYPWSSGPLGRDESRIWEPQSQVEVGHPWHCFNGAQVQLVHDGQRRRNSVVLVSELSLVYLYNWDGNGLLQNSAW